MTPSEDILARTIYGEARGEYARLDGGVASLIAVGNVVMNRVHARTWFGNDVVSVCQKPYQFSCWNANDPNRRLIEAALPTEEVFSQCMKVAHHLCKGDYPDLTKGSNHYHATSIKPSWAKDHKPRVSIGRHLFYRL